MNFPRIAAAGATALALLLTACGGGGGGIGGTGATAGTLRVSLTDAPSCGYDEVNVTVERVRVHRSATAADSDAGWSEIVLDPARPRRFDLLELSNGVLATLGQTALPSGVYTQMRLVLAENGPADPLANSVVPTGGSETPLDTPSAQQSGLKMKVNIDVPANQVVDVVVDFDACKSVVKRGSSGRYNLKPVLTVTPRLADAGLRIVGWVDPAIAFGSTSVSAQFQGLPIKATVPDPLTGQFVLYPVPVGSYDLVVSAQGRVTAVMTGVPVVETAHTFVNTDLLPILPSLLTASPRAVTGTVTPATANVRALQTLGGGLTIEVAWAPVDGDTGGFGFSLPVDAAERTAWVLNPLSLSFTPDAAPAGIYTIEASSGGARIDTPIDANAVVPRLTITFP